MYTSSIQLECRNPDMHALILLRPAVCLQADRCTLCGERVPPRSKVDVLGDTVRKGDEDNRYITAFFNECPGVVRTVVFSSWANFT